MKNLETNKMIARFLGWKEQTDPTERWFGSFKTSCGIVHKNTNKEPLLFHSSWDWLMEVVEKIELIEDKSFTVDFCHSYVQIQQYGKYLNEIVTTEGGDRKENLYNACVEFIKWYNENKEVN